MTWLAALVALSLPQDEKSWQQKIEDLQKQIDALKKQVGELQQERDRLIRENEFLRKDVAGLRTLSEEVMQLRQALKERGGLPPEAGKPENGQPKPLTPETGPVPVLRAKVLHAHAEFNFVVINKGEPDGVKPGYRFDIVRRKRDKDKPEEIRYEKLGVAEFEKFLGAKNEESKLKIVEGKAQDMKYEDEAIAHRKMPDLPADPSKPTVPAPGEKKFKITGKAGDAFMLNYGSMHGAKQSDRVFVYRDNKKRAELRIDTVDKDWSVARLIDKTKDGEFGEGDEVTTKDIKSPIVGKVKWNDDKHGIILEAGSKNGVKQGTQFEVRRQGRKIGVVIVKDGAKVTPYTCEVVPVDPLKREEIYVEDFVESVE